jgi:tetratricopeptide (TPR) repeat protein
VHFHTIDAAILDSLGYIAQHTRQPAVAIDYYQQGIDLSRRRGDIYQTANTLAKLGHPLVDLGQQDKACLAWREALELYQTQRRTAEADQMQLHLDALEVPA